jgi:hypothetical protein
MIRTLLLFPPFALVTYFNGAYGQDNGDDKEENTAYHSGCDSLVFNPRRHRELHFVATFVALERVGVHTKIIRASTHQVFYCNIIEHLYVNTIIYKGFLNGDYIYFFFCRKICSDNK